ncbi:MAG TPA: glycosyltransferase [Candidatus Anoxymicrobiaceae bacterium]
MSLTVAGQDRAAAITHRRVDLTMVDEAGKAGIEPDVSVVIPTLNAAGVLEPCLESIRGQEYSGALEIVIADGGSTDGTLAIAEKFDCIVVGNPLKTGEAGKAAGLKAATGDVIALIDSDNILPDERWMARMTAPFSDPAIAGCEPIEYTLRPGDPSLTRYCALIGMNDPLVYFLGNYDRMSVLSGTWTGLPIEARDRGDYLEVRLEADAVPTMGANGFMVRRELVELLGIEDYLFDIDVVSRLVGLGHDRFAKVKTGIVHLYGKGLRTFARKQLRRVRDYSYYSSQGMRSYGWSGQKRRGIARFIVYCLLVVPLGAQALEGYRRKPDSAWLLHVPACWITLVVYGWGFIEARVRPREQRREKWKQ